jgi:hypothetical protein
LHNTKFLANTTAHLGPDHHNKRMEKKFQEHGHSPIQVRTAMHISDKTAFKNISLKRQRRSFYINKESNPSRGNNNY